MAAPLLLWALLLFVAQSPPPACAQQSNCPSPARLYPPSGTTGNDPRQSTNYTLSGSLLDQVGTITVYTAALPTLSTTFSSSNGSRIGFNIADGRLRPNEILNATVSVVPSIASCMTTNFTITLYSFCKLICYFCYSLVFLFILSSSGY